MRCHHLLIHLLELCLVSQPLRHLLHLLLLLPLLVLLASQLVEVAPRPRLDAWEKMQIREMNFPRCQDVIRKKHIKNSKYAKMRKCQDANM